MYRSRIHQRGHVLFPDFANERHYMVPFLQQDGLPEYLSHWQGTVDQMLMGIESDRPIFFMCDQARVSKGETHRRPGVHVDGYWVPDISAHGGGHRGTHGPLPLPGHRGTHGLAKLGKYQHGSWGLIDFSEPELLILASSAPGCRAFVGAYDESLIGEGGECSRVDLSLLDPVEMVDHRAYVGTVGTIHESLPLAQTIERTIVRLNVPGVSFN